MAYGIIMEGKEIPSELTINPGDSSITKRVKRDYNTLSDDEFMGKYQCSKKTYAKRVARYSDPYMKSPLAKVGKALNKLNRNLKKRKSIESIIDNEFDSNDAEIYDEYDD